MITLGVFDHIDSDGRAIGAIYADRLRLIDAYDRLGIHAYHLAEHHSTPLGLTPSPSVFLSSVAQRTSRLRFGPMVYTLGLYHPLRLLEEISMLDQLSGGRFELGIGKGISPIEQGFFGVDMAQAPAIFNESFAILMQGFKDGRVDFHGKHFDFTNVPVTMRNVQLPHPPIWYGVAHLESVDWVAEHGMNMVSNQPGTRVRAMTDRYRDRWAAAGNAPDTLPFLGIARNIVVADTDAEAAAIGRRAYSRWYDNFMTLWRAYGGSPPSLVVPDNFDDALKHHAAVAGSPATVRDALITQIRTSGVNYVQLRFAFGDLTLDESLHSLERTMNEIAPELAGLNAVAA
jgi:alkanesulfonate monooxygenase SsuD/methylene tetrahydromethanopterin reductase-like flavin-dependent oxidoreductase (luciferase family)